MAGAVTEQVARLTNVPWTVDAAAITQAASLRHVHILNDLEAMAYSVAVLEPGELKVLQHGVVQPGGNAAVIAAGTGLGESLLLNVDGHFKPGESEAGHADWGARTPREIELLSAVTRVYGRCSNEHIICGPGPGQHLPVHARCVRKPHLHLAGGVRAGPHLRGVGTVDDPADLPAAISRSAMEKRCAKCVESLNMFATAYGAEAGNLALRTVATAGIYVGGGIAPKILPVIESGLFLDAFRAKEPLAAFVATIPLAVILNNEAGLLGAAVHANSAA